MGLLYTQALADRAQAWVSLPLNDKRYPAGLLELASIWAAINRLPLPECIRQCQYSERSAALVAYLRDFSHFQNPETVSDSSYQLAPQFANEKLVDEGYTKVVDASNLTDEDVAYFTKKGRKDLFVKKGRAAATAEEGGDDSTEVVSANPLVPQADLEAEQQAHGTTRAALDAEKQAHADTQNQLSEAQRQTADLTAQVAKLGEELTAAKAKKAKADDAAKDAAK